MIPESIRWKNEERWETLCGRFLSLRPSNSVWRFNRDSYRDEPDQGWKLHISANLLEACDVFEVVAPFLTDRGVQFKAPASLDELSRINSGLHYGYWQIGKFITVYPRDTAEAVSIAICLDRLTADFYPVTVPFDERVNATSSVFYRYGAFRNRTLADESGTEISVVVDGDGRDVLDDRHTPVPPWETDPFLFLRVQNEATVSPFDTSPLSTRYKVFEALKQRGKGGTYRAFDVHTGRIRVIKQGRHNGEVDWNGADGADLAEAEFRNLNELGAMTSLVPRVTDSFTIDRNFYFVMELIDGESLDERLRKRIRRLSFGKILEIAGKIADVICELHAVGWVWGDCKPANLIVTESGHVRPIDFEGAYRIGDVCRFDWKTEGFASSRLSGTAEDLFAFGAVIYFLVTGTLYDESRPRSASVIRRNIPLDLRDFIEKLLDGSIRSAEESRLAISAITEARRTR